MKPKKSWKKIVLVLIALVILFGIAFLVLEESGIKRALFGKALTGTVVPLPPIDPVKWCEEHTDELLENGYKVEECKLFLVHLANSFKKEENFRAFLEYTDINRIMKEGINRYEYYQSKSKYVETVGPHAGLQISFSSVIPPAKWEVDDTTGEGGIIINANDVVLECNNAVLVGKNRGIGINLNGHSGVIIIGCNITNYEKGIYSDQDANFIGIYLNNLYNNGAGIFIAPSTGQIEGYIIAENNIYDNLWGAGFVDVTSLDILKNNIIKNTNAGLSLNTIALAELQNNEIVSNKIGIRLDSSFLNIEGGSIKDNTQYDIDASAGSGFTLLNNVIIDYDKIKTDKHLFLVRHYVNITTLDSSGSPLKSSVHIVSDNKYLGDNEYDATLTTDDKGILKLEGIDAIISHIFNGTNHWYPNNYTITATYTDATTGINYYAYKNVNISKPTKIDLTLTEMKCEIPKDNMNIREDTTLCSGHFSLDDTDNDGYIITINDGKKVTCDKTVLEVKDSTKDAPVINLNSDKSTVEGCTIKNAYKGIYAYNLDEFSISNNNVVDSRFPIVIEQCRGGHITNNIINALTPPIVSNALFLTGSSNIVSSQNTYGGGSTTIQITESKSNNFTNDKITSAVTNIHVLSSSDLDLSSDNKFINTTLNKLKVNVLNGEVKVYWYLDVSASRASKEDITSYKLDIYNKTNKVFSDSKDNLNDDSISKRYEVLEYSVDDQGLHNYAGKYSVNITANNRYKASAVFDLPGYNKVDLFIKDIECTVPEDDLKIDKSMLFCPGEYTLPDKLGDKVIMKITEDEVELDCNGATLIGAGTDEAAMILVEGVNGVTIENCNIDNSFVGIKAISSERGIIKNNVFHTTQPSSAKTSAGILLTASDDFSVINNTFTADKTEMYDLFVDSFDVEGNNSFIDNVFADTILFKGAVLNNNTLINSTFNKLIIDAGKSDVNLYWPLKVIVQGVAGPVEVAGVSVKGSAGALYEGKTDAEGKAEFIVHEHSARYSGENDPPIEYYDENNPYTITATDGINTVLVPSKSITQPETVTINLGCTEPAANLEIVEDKILCSGEYDIENNAITIKGNDIGVTGLNTVIKNANLDITSTGVTLSNINLEGGTITATDSETTTFNEINMKDTKTTIEANENSQLSFYNSYRETNKFDKTTGITVKDDSLVNVYWELNVTVNNRSGGLLEGAEVTVTDKSENELATGTTDANGLAILSVQEFTKDSTNVIGYSPYNITVSKDNIENVTRLSSITTLSKRKITLNYPKQAICGDEVIDSGEECDGAELNEKTCELFGASGGELACTNCKFDLTDCTTSCEGTTKKPDGKLEGDEECDKTKFVEDIKKCEDYDSELYEKGKLSCTNYCTINVSNCTEITCNNNGEIDLDTEECDGEELGDMMCEDLDCEGGELSCTDDCKFNLTKCTECELNCVFTAEKGCPQDLWDFTECTSYTDDYKRLRWHKVVECESTNTSCLGIKEFTKSCTPPKTTEPTTPPATPSTTPPTTPPETGEQGTQPSYPPSEPPAQQSPVTQPPAQEKPTTLDTVKGLWWILPVIALIVGIGFFVAARRPPKEGAETMPQYMPPLQQTKQPEEDYEKTMTEYINTASATGLSREEITNNLIKQGWKKESIDFVYGEMPPQEDKEALSFIDECLKKKLSKGKIYKLMVNAGWDKDKVTELLLKK